MKKWIRLIATLLLMAMCLSALMACSDESSGEPGDPEDPSTSQEPSTPPPEEEDPSDESQSTLLDPAQAMLLVESEKTDYVIIRDDAATSNVVAMVSGFRDLFWAKTGVDIQVKKDTEKETPKEIIISMMDGRTQPAQEYAKLTAPEGKGYRISIVGESIVVASQEEYLGEALDLLAMAISDCGNGIWGVPKDYVGEMDLPTIPGTGALYSVSEGNYAYNVNNVTKLMVDGFLSDMEEDGFETYSEHTIGASKFVTYIKDSIYGQMVVHTMYHPDIRTFRLTYGPMEYLPNVTEQKADRGEPTITQMYLQRVDDELVMNGLVVSANNTAPGMSYLIQLSDGRFIVMDGGKADGTFQKVTQNANGQWVADTQQQSNDMERLYDTMMEMKPSNHDKPQIVMWFISHPHIDHYGLADKFLVKYSNKVELEVVAYNMPAFADLADSNEKIIETIKSNAKENFGAEIWTMHTGQKMELPGATVEVLSTVEDLYCSGNTSLLSDINNTCAVIRVNIGEMSFVVLGDAYPTTGQFMASAYGNALQSDIMQLSHHGFNGAVLELYKKIDPKICFWPCDEFRFQTDGRTLGTTGGYDFNYWLRTSNWTRDKLTGARKHYTASFTTTINANTGKITQS